MSVTQLAYHGREHIEQLKVDNRELKRQLEIALDSQKDLEQIVSATEKELRTFQNMYRESERVRRTVVMELDALKKKVAHSENE